MKLAANGLIDSSVAQASSLWGFSARRTAQFAVDLASLEPAKGLGRGALPEYYQSAASRRRAGLKEMIISLWHRLEQAT